MGRKKQQELDGFKRPVIEVIDEAATVHLEAVAEAKTAKEAAETAKATVLSAMLDNVKKLKKDDDGNHIYPYQDGDIEKVFVLSHDDSLRVRNAKKTTDVQGDIG